MIYFTDDFILPLLQTINSVEQQGFNSLNMIISICFNIQLLIKEIYSKYGGNVLPPNHNMLNNTEGTFQKHRQELSVWHLEEEIFSLALVNQTAKIENQEIAKKNCKIHKI